MTHLGRSIEPVEPNGPAPFPLTRFARLSENGPATSSDTRAHGGPPHRLRRRPDGRAAPAPARPRRHLQREGPPRRTAATGARASTSR
ncbi:MAG: hypothetical protein AVDCRST_MAG85-3858 [uncultured Solirubrobacteraceae bacterium]|uniref:Uncharacterized protein n=1 Tax=uncultured Solirubrobacteraceae bacterium TaxID=1162706 RepID=A0A6J4TXT7_9ACTN|nr:MAG: hypothetical protein AVDCRST_MAG85-3858 [uncultured Solirubrobacteraceae bacterium]